MSQIDWKKMDVEERYLYTHPLYPLVETHKSSSPLHWSPSITEDDDSLFNIEDTT